MTGVTLQTLHCPVLIDAPKHNQGNVRFEVSVVHALYNIGGPALVIIWYCFAGQIYLN